MTRPKFIGACLKKWRRFLLVSSWECRYWRSWLTDGIPRDVPKGHVAVYLGEDEKRYVIRVSVLDDPLFRALLDRASGEDYDFRTEPRLRIPCDENTFVDVVRCCTPREKRRTEGLCL